MRGNPSLRLLVLATLPTLVGLGCSTPDRPVVKEGWHRDRPPVPVQYQLAPGTVARLQVEWVGQAKTKSSQQYVAATLREALRQSNHFDLAAEDPDTVAGCTIQVHVNLAAQRLTSTLQRAGEAPIGLAAVTCPPAAPELGNIDALALDTRRALGETVVDAPVPAAQAYTESPQCLRWTERGRKEMARGQFVAAEKSLRQGRRFDGGSAYNLMQLAAATSALGRPDVVRRLSNEALRLSHRLTPTTRHRLARSFLQAQGDLRGLAALGRAYRHERPFDPQGIYTAALAHNLTGEAAEALPQFELLARRWPNNASVQYQLGFACLATKQPDKALAAFRKAAKGLPATLLVRPKAMAMFHAGKLDELERMLATWTEDKRIRSGRAMHELLRMQASLAILVHKPEEAAGFLLADLAWVRQHARNLDRYALDVAEAGDILARLGKARELMQAIQAFQQLGQQPDTFSGALTYLGGLITVAGNKNPHAAQAQLARESRVTWQNMLNAAWHRSRGELKKEAEALLRAMGGSPDPLVFASLARVLLAAGEKEKSAQMAERLQQTLVSFDQRRPHDHPLMSPARAMAYLATR